MIQVWQRQEADKLVLYREHNVFVMGSYAAEIWNLCDGEHTIDSIVKMAIKKYNLSEEKAYRDVIIFIDRLAESKLIIV